MEPQQLVVVTLVTLTKIREKNGIKNPKKSEYINKIKNKFKNIHKDCKKNKNINNQKMSENVKIVLKIHRFKKSPK